MRLVEWESFARSIWPSGATADPAEVRDDAEYIRDGGGHAVRPNRRTAGREIQRRNPLWDEGAGLTRASSTHGSGRGASGFELWAVIAEYRALRASVLRLWRESQPAPDLRDLDDVTRFNESMDQSLTEAVRSYAEQVERDCAALLVLVLEQVGAIVTTAGSVRQAIDALAKARP